MAVAIRGAPVFVVYVRLRCDLASGDPHRIAAAAVEIALDEKGGFVSALEAALESMPAEKLRDEMWMMPTWLAENHRPSQRNPSDLTDAERRHVAVNNLVCALGVFAAPVDSRRLRQIQEKWDIQTDQLLLLAARHPESCGEWLDVIDESRDGIVARFVALAIRSRDANRARCEAMLACAKYRRYVSVDPPAVAGADLRMCTNHSNVRVRSYCDQARLSLAPATATSTRSCLAHDL